MRIFSGTCCMCDVGIPTGEEDMHGCELFSGDVVQLWHGNYMGTDIEEWMPSSGLTTILGNQYQTYTDGTIELINSKPSLYTMGISGVGVQGGEWKVSLVKSHKDIIPGERFASFGINYREEPK
jgi:hypothetical protein